MILATRDAAVHWLRSQGLYAACRDWSFGESVIAAAGRQAWSSKETSLQHEATGDELVAYRHMLCLYPAQGAWSIAHLSGGFPATRCGFTLGEAASEAAKFLVDKLADEGGEGDC